MRPNCANSESDSRHAPKTEPVSRCVRPKAGAPGTYSPKATMLRSILTSLLSLAILPVMLISGCAKPPQTELAAARQAVAQAYAAGAVELASDDYQAAQAALRNAERLSDQGEYQAAREILSTAEAQARIATTRAREEKVRIEQERLRAKQLEEKRRQRELREQREKEAQAARKQIKSKPAPPPQVSSYKVKSDETLWQIAARPEVYGDELLWPLLYKANRDQITDPRKIYVDQELTVPRKFSAKDADAARKEARESGIFPLKPE